MTDVQQPTAGPSAPSAVPSPAPDSAALARADARALRIAAAVERGKTEYQAEHAYTERGWTLQSDLGSVSKKDRQAVEYTATLYLASGAGADEAARGVADIRACAPSGKLSGLPRELLATAAQCAVVAGDKSAAAEFARAAKNHWKANAGLAVECSAALAFAGEVTAATHPVLASLSQAVHYPVLAALDTRLAELAGTVQPGADADTVMAFCEVIHALADSRAWAFSRPLFASEDKAVRAHGAPANAAELRAKFAALDATALADVLKVDKATLAGVMGRIGRALGGSEENEPAEGERVERGVREL